MQYGSYLATPRSSFWMRPFQQHWGLFAITMALAALGIAMQYSAGGGWQPFAFDHLTRSIVGIAVMLFLTMIPLQLWYRVAAFIFIGGVITLALVLLVGQEGMGATRWLVLGPLRIQPSEPFKLALILLLASWFAQLPRERMHRPLPLLVSAFIIALPVCLIFLQPNLGTATITAAIGSGIWLLAGLSLWIVGGLLVALAIIAPIGWQFLQPYQQQRVQTFIDPESDPLGAGYNIIQSKIAIGSGGQFGQGYMRGTQSQLDFLPEKHTDFIFSILAEELGFVGVVATLVFMVLLIILCLRIGSVSNSRFGSLLAGGIACLLLVHSVINIGMISGLLPVVGVPLPFLSYGGSVLLTVFVGIGLVQRVWIERDRD